MVDAEAQAAKLLLDLQHLKGVSCLFFDFGDKRFQVLAQPPEDVDQPSPWQKPKDINVCRTSPSRLNHLGQRPTSFCSNSLRIRGYFLVIGTEGRTTYSSTSSPKICLSSLPSGEFCFHSWSS